MAVSLIYEDGLLTHGVTRGNGRVGDDITHNVRTIKDIPLRLDGQVPSRRSGEAETAASPAAAGGPRRNLHDQLRPGAAERGSSRAKGEPPFANTRNVTAGSIRQLDPRVCAERRLRFFCHSAGDTRGPEGRDAHGVSATSCAATAWRPRRTSSAFPRSPRRSSIARS